VAYPLLPIHPKYRGPSGEPGQIMVGGRARKVTAFHGRSDDEADWHVYLDLAEDVRRDLAGTLREAHSGVPADVLEEFWSELMVLDDWSTPTFGDDQFFSADVSRAFRLTKPGSGRSAWDLMLQAIDDQGDEQDFSSLSTLVGGRVYLQGPFVNDAAHGFLPEIHPLDSIAFAMDGDRKTVAAAPGQPGWPRRHVIWRVAFFTNSDHHRINGESYLEKQRTTTWSLAFPGDAFLPGGSFEVTEDKIELLDVPRRARYVSRGVAAGPTFEVVTPPSPLPGPPRPASGHKLRVSATMVDPNNYGGIVVRDYDITVRPPVVKR
jgi:hypothetical protein